MEPGTHQSLHETRGGSVSPGFAWNEPERTDDPYDVLVSEGVRFDDSRRAAPGQRINAAELAERSGLEITEGAGAWRIHISLGEAQVRLFSRIREIGMVETSLRHWSSPRPQHWYDVSIGSSRARLSMTLVSTENLVAVSIYIHDDHALFHSLERDRAAIESELGLPLTWRARNGVKARVIITTIPGDASDP